VLLGPDRIGKSSYSIRKQTTFKQKLDIIRQNRSVKDDGSKYPLYLKVEINGQCNLDCVMCRRTGLENRDKEMTLEQFNHILSELDHLVMWSPHGYNEPLMHPHFFDFVGAANEKNIRLNLVTNATMLYHDVTDRLMNYNPFKIIISMDATGTEYERIRRGAKWSQVKANVEHIVEATRGTDTAVSIQATAWRDNIGYVPDLIEFARGLDIPISVGDITWMNEYGESRRANAIMEDLSLLELARFKLKSDYSKASFAFTRKGKRTCTLPWSATYIDVVGDVFPCTDNLDDVYQKMGNIFETSFAEIWHSEKYRKFRVRSKHGLWDTCKNCLGWGPP
jgi:radical SAM protein with 4Fe4S-binding SPASM domain